MQGNSVVVAGTRGVESGFARPVIGSAIRASKWSIRKARG